MYANMLVEVGRLIYLIGNFSETSQLKKILQSSDGKSKIFYRCFEEVPSLTFEKIKYSNVREGILRSDWIAKMIDRYPQMIIFMFSCGDDSQDLQATDSLLREMLKRINLFFANFLKKYGKEEVAIKIIVKLTRTQFANAQIQGKVIYFLKTYEKDLFIIQNDLLGREIPKYRASWLSYLEKNYERKLRKIVKKQQQASSIDRQIGFSFKIAIMSEILCRDEKVAHLSAYNMTKYKFSQITKKEFNFLKFLQIRELRALSDTLVLRKIKFKIGISAKELPEFVYNHLNYFKMRSMDPSSCHFYYYYEELLWRSRLIQHLLEAFYESEVIDLLPKVFLAEIINGLLSYLHKMATIDENILKEVNGKPLEMGQQVYLGKANYLDITDADLVATGISYILQHKKDFIQKGIQIVTRYKQLGVFRQNQINFLNIYLIRFYLVQGKFSAFIEIYHEILKVEMNRCNYYLINELFSEIKGEMNRIDPASKALLTGVASLICDYFENKEELSKFLKQFYDLLGEKKPEEEDKGLFAKELAPEAHIFKLKKSSVILSAKISINEQIILGQTPFSIKVSLSLHEQLRSRLAKGDKLKLKFNQPSMIVEMQLREGEDQLQFLIQPLKFVRRDVVLKVDQIQVEMAGKNVVWLVERSQIVFERFDATLLYCKLTEPQITLNHLAKIYYLQETAALQINIKGFDDCKISTRLKISEEGEGGVEFFMNTHERKNLTNSKVSIDLQVSCNDNGANNVCWIKCTRLGVKTLTLQFTNVVERTLKVGWRQKPLILKSTTIVTKEIRFTVSNLFSVGKIFRQAQTGALQDNNIPICKKSLLSFYIKTIEPVVISQLDSNNNRQPNKIKYYKGPHMSNVRLEPSENLKVNMLFELEPSCQDQFELFLTTLIIKWSRVGAKHSFQNVHLEDIKINSIQDKLLITFEQQNLPLLRRQQSSLILRLQNLTDNQLSLRAAMQSSENLLRIGERSKGIILSSRQKGQITFQILGVHAGIFEFPPLKVFVNEAEAKVSTTNFLIYCA